MEYVEQLPYSRWKWRYRRTAGLTVYVALSVVSILLTLISSVFFFIVFPIAVMGFLLLQTRYDRQDAEWLVARKLEEVITSADAAIDEAGAQAARARLAKRIDMAASKFWVYYGTVGPGHLRAFRRAQSARARESADVLRSYVRDAAVGPTEALPALRDDMMRALLRVSAGRWFEVGELRQPPIARSWFRRLLGSGVVRSSGKILVPAIGAVLAALIKVIFGA
jgi:hypothetical protein